MWRMVSVSAMALAAAVAPWQTPEPPSLLVGARHEHVTVQGDSLRSLSARFGVSPRVIAADNGLHENAGLQPGQLLQIDRRHIVPGRMATRPIVINVPQRHLFHARDDQGINAYPIAVGSAGWRTPLGVFTIVEMEQHPVWDVPTSIQAEMQRAGRKVATTVLPGPDNPLGDFFVRLSFPGIGLHGTTAPSSIYQSVTHGCIRLHPDDIAALYEDVRVGTPGEIVYEPILLARTADGIVLEAHPNVYKRGPADGLTFVKGQVSAAGWTDAIDWRSVQSLLSSRDGSPRLISMAPSDEW